MKKYLVILVLLILSFVSVNTYAQTVTVCTFVNGVATVGKAAQMCKEDSIKLSMTNCASGTHPSVSYRWRNLSVAPYTDTLNSSAIAKDTGVWVGYIKNISSGIETSDTVHISYYPSTAGSGTIVSMTPNAGPYCPLDIVTISTSITGTFSSYQWYNQDLLGSGAFSPINGATHATFSFTDKPKIVMVVGKDSYGCNVDSLTSGYFSTNPFIPVELGPDQLACQGTSTVEQLTSSGSTTLPGYSGISYQYYRDGVLICTYGPQTGGTFSSCSIPFPTPGNVKVSVKILSSFIACANTDTMIVNVVAKPIVNLGPDSIICYNQSMDIKSTVSGAGSYTYNWTSTPYPAGTPVSIPAGSAGNPNITVTPTTTAYYKLSVTDAASCGIGKDSILLTENPEIFTTISNDTTVCRFPLGATTVNLKATATGGTGPLTYSWSPVGVSYGLSSTNTLTTTATPNLNFFVSSAAYFFHVVDANHCSPADKNVTINLYAPPINSIPDPIIISETVSATLNASTPANNGYSFAWRDITSATVISTDPSLFVEYNGPDTVNYVITVYPSSGLLQNCINRDTIEVRSISDNTLLYVPNVFSPNAMESTNQRLRIYGDNLLPDGFKLIVYNKWGNLMFETSDLNEAKVDGWDGGAQIEGVYTYVIVGKFKNGKDVKESPHNKGTFSLIK